MQYPEDLGMRCVGIAGWLFGHSFQPESKTLEREFENPKKVDGYFHTPKLVQAMKAREIVVVAYTCKRCGARFEIKKTESSNV